MGYTIQNCACCQSDCCACGECEFSPDATVDFSLESWTCQSFGASSCDEIIPSASASFATGLTVNGCGSFTGTGSRYDECISFGEGCDLARSDWDSMCSVAGDGPVEVAYDCTLGCWTYNGAIIESPDGQRITDCTGGTITYDSGCNYIPEADLSDRGRYRATVTVNNNEGCEGAPPP